MLTSQRHLSILSVERWAMYELSFGSPVINSPGCMPVVAALFLFVFFSLIESALTLFWERAANHATVYTTVFCRCRSESEPVCRQFAFRLNVIYGFKNGCDGSATGSVSSARSLPSLSATLSQQTSISSVFTKRTDRHIWDTPRARR